MDVQEKLSVSCLKMAKPVLRHRHYTYRPRPGKVFIDPNTGTRYVLLEIIGKNVHTHNHKSFDLIYKACSYDCRNKNSLLPSGYSTIKFIRPGLNIDWPTVVAGKFMTNSKSINIDKWVIQKFNQGILVTLPYMSEGSLRYILSTRFRNGLLEGCIAIALKQAFLGLIEIHNLGMVHKRFSAENIYVNFKQRPIWNAEIKLGFAATIYDSELGSPRPKNPSNPELWSAAPEVFYSKYDKLLDKLKDVLEEKEKHRFLKAFNNKLKYVKTERKFSKEFEELVLDCFCSKKSERQSVGDLLQRPFFRYAKNLKWFQHRVLYAKNPISA